MNVYQSLSNIWPQDMGHATLEQISEFSVGIFLNKGQKISDLLPQKLIYQSMGRKITFKHLQAVNQ